MRTALTVLSSLAATRAEMIEAEQERAETIIADSMAIERAAEDVHELLEQACAARGLNTAGPTKELVTRLAESGASMRGLLETELAQARAELEAERARHEATRGSVDQARHLENKAELQRVRTRLLETRDEANTLELRLGTAMRLLENTAHELMDQPWRDDFAALQQEIEREKCKL